MAPLELQAGENPGFGPRPAPTVDPTVDPQADCLDDLNHAPGSPVILQRIPDQFRHLKEVSWKRKLRGTQVAGSKEDCTRAAPRSSLVRSSSIRIV